MENYARRTGTYEFKRNMKRICNLCLQEHRYDKVKKYTTKRAKHALLLCNYCIDVLYFEISDMIKKYGT